MLLISPTIPGCFTVTLARDLAMSGVMTDNRVHHSSIFLVSPDQPRFGRVVRLLESYCVPRVTFQEREIPCFVLLATEGVPTFAALSFAGYSAVGSVGYDRVVCS